VSEDVDSWVSGVSIRDQFLAPAQIRSLVQSAHLRRARSDFDLARIGGDRGLQRREDIRGDSICWLTEPLFAPERALLTRFEGLRVQMNRDAFLGLFELELHYAWYPPGTGYARHVDQPQNRDRRRVSLVLYLNERWEASDGGELRIFSDDERHRDIEPVAGRLVVFLTERREHEVLPTRRGRLSITGWFRSRE